MGRKFYRKEREKKRKILKTLGKALLLCAFFGILAFFALFFYFANDLPNPQNISSRQIAQSTKIYDKSGKVLLYDIHGEEKRTIVPFDQISEYLKKATIATEDAEFYQHKGIQLRGIIRGAYKTFIKNEVAQSGSTITQQLVKNSFLSPEKTFSRKIREMILAIALEKKYSKDEILEFYLNQIPYGSNAYGAEAASQLFFEKSARSISIAEAALLAALPQAPSYYSPWGNHTEELLARKNYIVKRMFDLNMISEGEKNAAMAEEIVFSNIRQDIKAPHFVMFVRDYLNEKYGEEYVEKAGFSVYTSIDWEIQKKAEEIVKRRAEENMKISASNAALVALDAKTGGIVAMVGSKDYFDVKNDGNVNVTIRHRSPGSAFKPIVYAKAFEKGFTPQTILFDLQTEFNQYCDEKGGEEKDKYGLDCYHPQNYSGKFVGPVSMKDALAQSLNVPAVKTLYLTGLDDVITLAKKMGISTLNDRSRYGLSLTLGGGEIKLLELAQAYSVFANAGTKISFSPVVRIVDAKGNVMEEHKPSSQKVLNPSVVRIISNILSDNNARAPVFGERSSLYFEQYQVAAKTGTTQDYRDAWTVGYTPDYVVGVWAGNNDNSKMKKGSAGANAAGPLWHEFMEFLLSQNSEKALFDFVDFPPSEKPMLNGSVVNKKTVSVDKISGLLATDLTPANLIEEKMFNQIHSILYYIDKNNVAGPVPEHPESDPLFSRFEYPVLEWIKSVEDESIAHINEQPPIAFDNVHIPENRPRVTVVSPRENDELKSSGYNYAELFAEAPLGVKQADFFLDGIFLGSNYRYPFSFNYLIPEGIDLSKPDHFLRIMVYDSVQNNSEETVPLLLAQ